MPWCVQDTRFSHTTVWNGRIRQAQRITCCSSTVAGRDSRRDHESSRSIALVTAAQQHLNHPNVSRFTKVVHKCHSYGSIVTVGLLMKCPTLSDGAIKTGWLISQHNEDHKQGTCSQRIEKSSRDAAVELELDCCCMSSSFSRSKMILPMSTSSSMAKEHVVRDCIQPESHGQ